MVERASLADLDEILGLFDAVQSWLVSQGLKEQWGDAPFSKSEAQRVRFATWLNAGVFRVVRQNKKIVGTLQLSAAPPEYARAACAGWGGYLDQFVKRPVVAEADVELALNEGVISVRAKG